LRLMRLRFLIMLLAVIMAAGCQPKPRVGYLAPEAIGPKGYQVDAGSGVIDTSFIRMSARQVKKGEETSKLLSALVEKGYILIALSIENTSGKTVIYKPNLTVLTNDAFDFLRPLDYTDLYSLDDMEGLEEIKGRFYDLDVTLRPGQRTAKLLIFRALSKNVKKINLQIDDLYVGTEPIRLTFPFYFKPEA